MFVCIEMINKSLWKLLHNLKLRVYNLHVPVIRRLSKLGFKECKSSCFWEIDPWIYCLSEIRSYRFSVRIGCGTLVTALVLFHVSIFFCRKYLEHSTRITLRIIQEYCMKKIVPLVIKGWWRTGDDAKHILKNN